MTRAQALMFAALLTTAAPNAVVPEAGCTGAAGGSVGRMGAGDRGVEYGGLLLGRWQSARGTLDVRLVPGMQGDVVVDSLGGTWKAGPVSTAIRRLSYAPATRTVALEFNQQSAAPPFASLVLEPDGMSLTSGSIRLVREMPQHAIAFDTFTQSLDGVTMRAADGVVRVTAPAGAPAMGRLTSTWRVSNAFTVDLAIDARGAAGFAQSIFVCVGVVNDEPAYWDPHRHVMAGRVQGAEGAVFSMEFFSRGAVRRYLTMPTPASGGRVRFMREQARSFALFDDGRGWMPIGTGAADLWDGPRLVIVFGNRGIPGFRPALDFTITDLRITGE